MITQPPECDEIEVGQTIRINHDLCPAGIDSRQRQYITRPQADPAKLIWHCFNCGHSGLYTSKDWEPYRTSRFVPMPPLVDEESGVVTEPHGLTDPDDWPTSATAYAYRRGLTKEQCARYGIKHDPSNNAMYFPRYWFFWRDGEHEKYMGYQLRALDKHYKQYLTALNKDAETYSIICDDSPATTVVVVEDLISGIRVHEATGYHCFVLYGLRCEPTHMYKLATGYAEVAIWLDNDGDQVTRMAATMDKTIKMYDPSVRTMMIESPIRDAKYYQDEEIREILRGFD